MCMCGKAVLLTASWFKEQLSHTALPALSTLLLASGALLWPPQPRHWGLLGVRRQQLCWGKGVVPQQTPEGWIQHSPVVNPGSLRCVWQQSWWKWEGGAWVTSPLGSKPLSAQAKAHWVTSDSKKHLSYSPWVRVGVAWCCLAAGLLAEHPLLSEFQTGKSTLSLAGN